MMNTIIILISVLLNASAQLFLKSGAMHLNTIKGHGHLLRTFQALMSLPMFFGFICYGASIILWIYALSKVDVSYAYPFQAIGYVLVTLVAFMAFHEALTPSKLIGILLISSGVFFVARTAV